MANGQQSKAIDYGAIDTAEALIGSKGASIIERYCNAKNNQWIREFWRLIGLSKFDHGDALL